MTKVTPRPGHVYSGPEGVFDGVRRVWLRGPDGKVFRPHSKQVEFFKAVKKYEACTFFGGAGAGKTTAMCAALCLFMLSYPGTTWMVGRLNYQGLVRVTWRMLRQMMPKECVLYACDSQQNLVLALKNGSLLYGWNLLQWEKFQGLNLAGACIDEQTEIQDRMIYDAVAMRVRANNGPRKLFGACMPNGRDWSWRLFIADPPPGYIGIRARTADNPSLTPDYEGKLRRLYSPEQQARFLDAEFTALSGLVLFPWDEEVHLVDPFPIPKHWPRYRALDPGFHNDPAACLWATVDETGNLYLYDEYYETGKVIREQVGDILAQTYPAKVEWTVIDPNACRRTEDTGREHLDLYADYGLTCIEGSRSRRETGVEAVLGYLRPDPDHLHPFTGQEGAPRLYVFRTMKHFRDEIGGWVYDSRGRPREKNDHLMDALRYLILKRPQPAERPLKVPLSGSWKTFWEGIADEAGEASLPFIGNERAA